VLAVIRGAYEGGHLTVNVGTRHLYMNSGSEGARFSIRKHGVDQASFDDFAAGPGYVQLVSELNGRPLYLANDKGKVHFKDVDPNVSKHDAFNNDPVNFVIKIVDKPGEERK
jgi:hypothetical protein